MSDSKLKKPNKITVRISDLSKSIIEKKIKEYNKKHRSEFATVSSIVEDCIQLSNKIKI